MYKTISFQKILWIKHYSNYDPYLSFKENFFLRSFFPDNVLFLSATYFVCTKFLDSCTCIGLWHDVWYGGFMATESEMEVIAGAAWPKVGVYDLSMDVDLYVLVLGVHNLHKKVLHCKHVSVMQKINVLVLGQSGIRSTDAKLINFIAILIRSVIQCFNNFNFRATIWKFSYSPSQPLQCKYLLS